MAFHFSPSSLAITSKWSSKVFAVATDNSASVTLLSTASNTLRNPSMSPTRAQIQVAHDKLHVESEPNQVWGLIFLLVTSCKFLRLLPSWSIPRPYVIQ